MERRREESGYSRTAGHEVPASWDWSIARRRCLREARRILRDPHDAEEAVQEALIRAWRQRNRCRTPSAPTAWLLQITRNESLRILDRRGRTQRREAPDERPLEASAEDPALERLPARIATEGALSGLRADDRALLELRYVADLSQPEVARVLGLPEGTVKVRLHRIRGRLRRAMEEDLQAT